MSFNKQKAFGQHFLKDTAVTQQITDRGIDALLRYPEASLLEIGPGKGAITNPILEQLKHSELSERAFYLAERDRELIEYWRPEGRVSRILEGDFNQVESTVLDALGPLVVVSNLPYSAGTSILVKLAERSSQISEMVLMFQAEVAKRLYAEPSTRDRGSLSLYIQNEWTVERFLEVHPNSFSPPPKVMSEVVHLTRKSRPEIDVQSPQDRSAFSDLLKTAFRFRRKMLRGNFKGTRWESVLQRSSVDETKRAESLVWSEWVELWKNRNQSN